MTIIECIILNEEIPDYMEVSWQNNFIYILVSKAEYLYSSLSERMLNIFEILKQFCGDILGEFSVIVETFTSEELTGLFKLYER